MISNPLTLVFNNRKGEFSVGARSPNATEFSLRFGEYFSLHFLFEQSFGSPKPTPSPNNHLKSEKNCLCNICGYIFETMSLLASFAASYNTKC